MNTDRDQTMTDQLPPPPLPAPLVASEVSTLVRGQVHAKTCTMNIDHTSDKHNPWAVFYYHDPELRNQLSLATPKQRGVWFGVVMRAIYENTGPRLPDLLNCNNRQIWMWVGCTKAELKAENPLLRIEGNDVVVAVGYPDWDRFKQIRRRESNTIRKQRYRVKLRTEQ
jgi:hypothetical protein